MKALLQYAVFTLGLIFFAGDATAQRQKESNKVTPKSAQQKEAAALEQKQSEYKSRKDHHLESQDKATRKRMKKTLKKAERHSWGKQAHWYKRWFRRQ